MKIKLESIEVEIRFHRSIRHIKITMGSIGLLKKECWMIKVEKLWRRKGVMILRKPIIISTLMKRKHNNLMRVGEEPTKAWISLIIIRNISEVMPNNQTTYQELFNLTSHSLNIEIKGLCSPNPVSNTETKNQVTEGISEIVYSVKKYTQFKSFLFFGRTFT